MPTFDGVFKLISLISMIGGFLYVGIDRWVHRAENKDPSLQVQIQELRTRINSFRRNRESDSLVSEAVRTERAKAVSEKIENLDKRLDDLNKRLSDFEGIQTVSIGKLSIELAEVRAILIAMEKFGCSYGRDNSKRIFRLEEHLDSKK